MCYAVHETSTPEQLAKRFKAQAEADFKNYHPAGGKVSAFIHPRNAVITGEKPELIQALTWGLIPAWAKPDKVKDLMNQTLNARAETLFEKPSFRDSARHRRCLVLVDGFYEWQHRPGGKKQPYLITRPDKEPFAIGGVWSEWADPSTGEVMQTFSIVTTDANELMAEIHNTKKRMPLVFAPEVERHWIETDLPLSDVKGLMVPLPEGELVAREVTLS